MPNTILTAGQIGSYAAQAGFAGPSLVTAIAVGLAESGGSTWAINNDSDGSQDQGLWQINTVHAGSYPGMTRDPGTGHVAAVGASTMFDPGTNARAAWAISSGGSSFSPWSTFTSGAYTANLAQAQSVVSAANAAASAADKGPVTQAMVAAYLAAQVSPSTAGAPGGTAAQSGFGYSLVDDYDAPILTGPDDQLALGNVVPGQITGLIVAGAGDVGPYVTAGSVELDADQVGQVTFTVQDPDAKLAAAFVLRAPVTYKGLNLRIAAREVMPGGGTGAAWQITARVAIAQQMKFLRNPPTMPSGATPNSGGDTLGDTATPSAGTTAAGTGAAYSDGVGTATSTASTDASGNPIVLAPAPVAQNPNPGTSITPTDYIAYWCNTYGGTLRYGAPTYTQSVISPTPTEQGINPEVYGETLFDVVSRLASNYGYWFFDADGTNVWFGPPGSGSLTYEQGQGIISRGTPFKVGWAGAWGDPRFDAVTFPDCRDTTDDVLVPATIVVKVPRGRGELVRPGMCMWLKGVPNFDGDGGGQPYVVTKVSWALDAGETPVQVTAVTPINPVPTDTALLPQPLPATPGTGNQGLPYNEQFPLLPNAKVTHLSADFVTIALQQQGKPYVWGAAGSSSFDCSGLVEYAAAQVGITYPAPGVGGTRSQAQYATSAQAGDTLPVASAAGIRGALLFAGQDGNEHVGISLGDSQHTLEGLHPGSNIQIVDNGNIAGIQSRFQYGATIPGVDYNTQPTTVPISPPSVHLGHGGQ